MRKQRTPNKAEKYQEEEYLKQTEKKDKERLELASTIYKNTKKSIKKSKK